MIFYAGNILSSHGYTPTFIESLAPKLSELYEVMTVSSKLSQKSRLIDMTSALLRNRKKINAVLIDSYSLKAFWFSYILSQVCRIYGIPYIPILHGGSYPDRLKKSPFLCKQVFSNSYVNVSPSIYLKEHFEREGFKVKYIPNFIDLTGYSFRKRDSFRPNLLWVRSFHELYNPGLAIEILKIIKEKYPQASLCMVGPDKDGSMEKVMESAISNGLADSVKFTGKLSRSEWTKLSEEYDIFINTTNFDNHPISVIEAMALGLPVVSTRVGGIPYLIEDGTDGLLCEPNDADAFTEKVIMLLEDNKLAENISLNARSKAECFSWETLKKEWTGLLDKFAERKAQNVVS